MRKQGFMKRVLGGIMAVAFGAALCFAAPMKAEAALPPGWAAQGFITEGQEVAATGQLIADSAAIAAQDYLGKQIYWASEQLWAQANIAQTTASAKLYLAALGSGLQGLSLVPEAYRVPVATAIYEQQALLRGDAISFINDNYLYGAYAADEQAKAYLGMQNALAAQVMGMQWVQAGMVYDAQTRAYLAQYNAYEALQRQLVAQDTAAYNNMLAAMGLGAPNYGF